MLDLEIDYVTSLWIHVWYYKLEETISFYKRYASTIVSTYAADDDPVNSFEDMSLSTSILKGIYSRGFKAPYENQGLVIRSILQGNSAVSTISYVRIQ